MLLELAEQSIQLLKCHISRRRLCHRSPQDNQSKSWKKSLISVFLSLITSHALSTSRAEHTPSNRGRATTSFISYHKIKTCYLKTINLNLGRRCGQTEIVCHWSLLMSLELAEHSIQLLTCHISRWRLCHCSQQDNQSKSWKKVWPLFFLSLITSHAVSTSRAEQTTFYRGRATTSFISYHQLKTLSLLSKVLKKSVTSVFFVIDHFSRH